MLCGSESHPESALHRVNHSVSALCKVNLILHQLRRVGISFYVNSARGESHFASALPEGISFCIDYV
jgi:hypothetical protein